MGYRAIRSKLWAISKRYLGIAYGGIPAVSTDTFPKVNGRPQISHVPRRGTIHLHLQFFDSNS